jgi:integrase/recombinase XerD
MTHLRKMMLEELQRRNYSENTIRSYIRTVEDFARRFKCPPDRLGPQHIRQYQAELFQKRKLSSGTVVICLAALRFFYTKTLRRPWSIADTPYPKKTHRLPTILSQEEVAQLIDAASTPFHRTLLMTLYGTGARNQEVTHLKFRDVDSKRMVIHIKGGKGRRDRDVMLSLKLLEELREHWYRVGQRPRVWLFPGNRRHSADRPIIAKTVWNACQNALKEAFQNGQLHFHGDLKLLAQPKVHWLRAAAEDGFPCYPLFEHDSNLDHLRNDPGFLSFLAEQKKQWEYFREHL